mmetsp:Transcript_52672/g.47301  ORF Transcript_52672/g.47301 Transcript_52672/m.47301 type:complete len:212 (-) Transcript_52672:1294-1929(-)
MNTKIHVITLQPVMIDAEMDNVHGVNIVNVMLDGKVNGAIEKLIHAIKIVKEEDVLIQMQMHHHGVIQSHHGEIQNHHGVNQHEDHWVLKKHGIKKEEVREKHGTKKEKAEVIKRHGIKAVPVIKDQVDGIKVIQADGIKDPLEVEVIRFVNVMRDLKVHGVINKKIHVFLIRVLEINLFVHLMILLDINAIHNQVHVIWMLIYVVLMEYV